MCALAVMPSHLLLPSTLPVNGKQTHQRCDEIGQGHGMETPGGRMRRRAGVMWSRGTASGMAWDRRRLSTEASQSRLHTLKGMSNCAGGLGAVFRTVLETMRTLFVWLVDLLLFYTPLGLGKLGESWTAWSFMQAAG